ncbi:multidrug effflux MFS transporter [Bowdeniella massiliensis]|uniref:multidrug effflux MFS transporter n=1 Tax=Bowdeniella massiliensis TaxID=2932264 RepID=UPI0020288D0A
MPNARLIGFVFLLGAMAAVPAVTVDMYLPSLPEVAADFRTSPANASATITGMLIGGAVGQILVGTLSDKFGRKAPFAVGLLIHTATSIACIFAPSIFSLIALRVLQGIGNAAATVTSMAIIRDRFHGARAAAIMSRLMLVIGLAPLLAPTVGGFIATHWHWRAVFGVLATFGALVLLATLVFMPETHPPQRRMKEPLRKAFRTYGILVRDKQFMALAIVPALALSALFSYVAASPFVLREGFGLSEGQFAIVFAINGLGIVAGAQVNARLVATMTPLRILRRAMPIEAIMALGVVLAALIVPSSLIAISIPLFIVLALNAVVMPNATATALSLHGERAGSAAAVVGATQAGLAGIISPVVGLLGSTAVAMGSLIAIVVTIGYILVRAVPEQPGPSIA